METPPALYELLRKKLPGIFFRGKYNGHYALDWIGEGVQDLVGYTPDELVKAGYSLNDLIHPDDKQLLTVNHQLQYEKGEPFSNEFRIISKRGEIKWVMELTTYTPGNAGEETAIEGYVQDITPFKTGVSMSNAYKSYQDAVNSGSLVSVTDVAGRIIFANEHFCNVSQYSRKELIGASHSIVNSGFHPKSFFKDMWEVILAGKIWRGQILNKAKDNSLYWVETVISPIFGSKNKIEQFLSIRSVITEQKEAEYNLMESEALNRSILDSMQAGIIILDEYGDVLKVNKAWEEIAGAGAIMGLLKVMPGDNYFNVLEDELKQGNKTALDIQKGLKRIAGNNGIAFEVEFYCYCGGEKRWFMLHITKFGIDLERLVLSHFDITLRKQHEEAIENSEARLQEAQRIAKIGSWELDLENGNYIWSDETYRIFGKEKSSFASTYSAYLELVHPEERSIVETTFQDAVREKKTYNIDHRLLMPDGRIKYVNVQCETYYNNEGKALRSVGTIQDITKQKESEILLENQRIRYENVVGNISDGLIIDDIDGKVVFANKQFMNMVGIKESDLKDFVFVDYVAPEYKDEIVSRHHDRMMGKNVASVFEYEGLKKDGSRRWFEARVSKIENGGKIIGTQSAIRDITELKLGFDLLKKSEEEKTNLIRELNQRFNELMQFNYIVSHNLRAPIANLMGLTDLFGMDATGQDEKDTIIKHIKTSINKIDELIKDLNIILASRSDINSKREWMRFEDIINMVRVTLDKQIKDAGAEINVRIAAGSDRIFSIRSYIKSCIYNLVNNAIKYRLPDIVPKVQISIGKKKSEYTIKVEDNGIGIDLERYGNEIFGLYKRFHPSFEGKGMGLNMTRSQIESLGGTIHIDSTPGKGTCFTITLPEAVDENLRTTLENESKL